MMIRFFRVAAMISLMYISQLWKSEGDTFIDITSKVIILTLIYVVFDLGLTKLMNKK